MAKTVAEKQNDETTDALAIAKDDKLMRENLKAIKTVEDITRIFGGKVVEVREVVGDFALVDSSELINRPFMVAHWKVNESDEYGKFNPETGLFDKGEYVSVYVITNDDKQERLIFNDGGTGIRPTLENFTVATEQTGGLNCPFGLRASEYEVVVDGKKSKATTMYFATSKPKS